MADMWVDSTSTFTQRCVFMDISGLENSGKTSLALSAPGSIALIHAAEKINGVVQPYVKAGKKVREHRYGFIGTGDPVKDQQAAIPVWNGLRLAHLDAVGKWARTVIHDTGNQSWEMVRLAHHGQLNPKGNRMDALWGPVNNAYRSMLANTYRSQTKTNVITLHHLGDQYVDKMKEGKMQSVKTGRLVRKGGFKEIPFIAEVMVECHRKPDGGFMSIIKKGWFNTNIENIELDHEFMDALGYSTNPITGSAVHFASIMAYITDTPEMEWMK